MEKAALVIIFNHRFEKNIPKLEAYYSSRFSHRSYLMPFAGTETDQIIRVFENSQIFSGHIAQGANRYKVPDVTHYVFAGDDLILNPKLTESNLVQNLHLDSDTAYIKSLSSADDARFGWQWSLSAFTALSNPKLDYARELPSAQDAKIAFEKLGVTFQKPYPRSSWDTKWLRYPAEPRTVRELYWALGVLPAYLRNLSRAVTSIGKPSNYPILAGYSDFIVVPAAFIDTFVHYCGVFAALNLFAEIAVPTALALACPKVQTELVLGDHFAHPEARPVQNCPMRGIEFWEAAIAPFCESFGWRWSRLMDQFPDDVLYYHPIKLSQWK